MSARTSLLWTSPLLAAFGITLSHPLWGCLHSSRVLRSSLGYLVIMPGTLYYRGGVLWYFCTQKRAPIRSNLVHTVCFWLSCIFRYRLLWNNYDKLDTDVCTAIYPSLQLGCTCLSPLWTYLMDDAVCNSRATINGVVVAMKYMYYIVAKSSEKQMTYSLVKLRSSNDTWSSPRIMTFSRKELFRILTYAVVESVNY